MGLINSKQSSRHENDKSSQLKSSQMILTSNINEIVNSIIPNNDGIRQFDLTPDYFDYNDIEIEQDLVDELRPLKNIATEFVVNEFFTSEASLFHFMLKVYNTFDEGLAVYRKKFNIKEDDLFFLYKGGNVLRIVSGEFLLELPSSATREIDSFYSQYFKRGDADFTIYMNPELNDYEDRFKDVNLLSYLLQVRIRNEFITNPTQYFDYAKYSDEFKSEILDKYLIKFNQVAGFKFKALALAEATSDNTKFDVKLDNHKGSFYEPKHDIGIEFVNDNDINVNNHDDSFGDNVRIAREYHLVDDPSLIVVSYNSALDFPSGSNGSRRTKFTLVRSKVQFSLFTELYPNTGKFDTNRHSEVLNIGGELIDVSMSHRDNTGIDHFFEHQKQYVKRYSLTFNNETLNFNSYGLPYLTEDLETILFLFNRFPWEDEKYSKRINRLFYMYFVDIFTKLNSSDERTSILQELKNNIFIPLSKLSGKADINKNLEAINKFRNKHSEHLLVMNLLKYLTDLLGKLKNSTPEDFKNMREMCALLARNASIVVDSISKVRQYCSFDGSIKVGDIYKTNANVLL